MAVFLSVSILSAKGTIFGRFFVSLRQEGGYAFSKKSGQDKNVIDHSSYHLFSFSELTILKMPPGGRQSSGLFLSAEVLRGMYFVPVCHTVAHHIVAHILTRMNTSPKLINCDQ